MAAARKTRSPVGSARLAAAASTASASMPPNLMRRTASTRRRSASIEASGSVISSPVSRKEPTMRSRSTGEPRVRNRSSDKVWGRAQWRSSRTSKSGDSAEAARSTDATALNIRCRSSSGSSGSRQGKTADQPLDPRHQHPQRTEVASQSLEASAQGAGPRGRRGPSPTADRAPTARCHTSPQRTMAPSPWH